MCHSHVVLLLGRSDGHPVAVYNIRFRKSKRQLPPRDVIKSPACGRMPLCDRGDLRWRGLSAIAWSHDLVTGPNTEMADVRGVAERATSTALMVAGVKKTRTDRLGDEFVVRLSPHCAPGLVQNSVDLPGRDIESVCYLGLAEALTSKINRFKLSGRKLCHKPDGISTAPQIQESTFRYGAARESCVVQ